MDLGNKGFETKASSVLTFEVSTTMIGLSSGESKSMKSLLHLSPVLPVTIEFIGSSSSVPCYGGRKSLGVDFTRSTSAMESAVASHPKTDLELAPSLLVTLKEGGSPVTCCSYLCIPGSIGVEIGGWLRFESMAEVDSFFLFEWPVLEPVGALDDTHLVALMQDIEGCFKEDCFLCTDLAPGFLPWESFFSLCEEVLGALKATGVSALQIANM
ncbi:hypothetical protein Tco_1052536 [Tanacetum coccineum]